MRTATALFLVLLAAVHVLDPESWDRPLSELRDGPFPLAGYALFGLLLAVGVLHVRVYRQAGRWRSAAVPVAALVLLAVVAATPSFDEWHAIASLLLIGLVFVYHAGKLWLVSSPWLFAHLAAPVVILMISLYSGSLSYGVWQKGLILYFLLAVNLDALLATGSLSLPGPDDFRRRRKRPRVAYSPRVQWRRTDDGRSAAGDPSHRRIGTN